MYFSCVSDLERWEGFQLVLPAVSVGNVAQLTCDLLISTLHMEKVGYIYDDSILPMVGNDPFAKGEAARPGTSLCHLVVSMEVFRSVENKLVVIQQRAPFVKGKAKKFRGKLLDWVQKSKFSEVIVLSSSFAHERRDKEITGPQLRYLFSPAMEELHGATVRDVLCWQKMDMRDVPTGLRRGISPPPTEGGEGQEDQLPLFIPGGGIAKALLVESTQREIPCGVLLNFCAEGDNIDDAVALADYVNAWKGILKPSAAKKGWSFPSSWQHMYGTAYDQRLFH